MGAVGVGVVGVGGGGVGGVVGVGGAGATVVGTSGAGGGVAGRVVTGGGGAGCWAVLGAGRCGAVVPGAVVGVDSVDFVDAAEELELASPAARVKSLENGDQVTGVLGSGNDPDPPSRSTTTLMKSPQICAGKLPPATAMPWTLNIERLTPSALG